MHILVPSRTFARPQHRQSHISELERRTVVVDWNATAVPRSGVQCLHRVVETQASSRDAAIAVVSAQSELTYGLLDRRANRLARTLRALGVQRETFVGVCLERSIDAIVTLLAIAKAGGAFVPLDPSYPTERLRTMLADASPRVVVTTGHLRQHLSVPSSTTLTTIEELDAAAALQSEEVLVGGAEPDDAAYVIYTSGSTGSPKGVVVSHRSACNMVLSARNDFALGDSDRLLQLAPLSFDPSVWQIFGTLALGGCIVLPTSRDNNDVASIARDVVKHRVTFLMAVPELLTLLLERPELHAATSLRAIVSGGSRLTPTLRDRCFERLQIPLYNVYGPTEATIHVTTYRCDLDDRRDVIPIGRPIENVQAYILDEQRALVPIGTEGELYIGGTAVARGYLNHRELTAERFVPDPFAPVAGSRLYRTGDLARYLPDGNIEFLGRVDEQVKVRGIRVEPAEVEAALERNANVARAAVLLHKRDDDERLVAFVVPRDQAAYDVAALRAHASSLLPPAIVPSTFIPVQQLATLPNGKIDRRTLAAAVPVLNTHVAAAAGDSLIRFLVDLWEELLNVRDVRVTDDFFVLGGHSLLAARLVSRIEAECGRRVALSTFFNDPTIAGMAAALRRAERAQFERIVRLQTGGEETPFFFLHGDYTGLGLYARRFARTMADRAIYAIPPHGADGGEVPATVEEMARDSLSLVRSVQPTGPYVLGGYCMGGVVALEMARQLCESGELVTHLVIVGAQGLRSPLRRWLGSRRRDAREVLQRLRGRTEDDEIVVAESDPLTVHVLHAQGRALNAYRWRHVPVHASMLCARDARDVSLTSVRRGWADLFDELDVRLIPGNHTTSLTRHLPELAAELAEVLRCSAEAV